jgi:multidrug efflux pump subunit AcrB
MRFTDVFIRRAITTTLLISAIAGFGLLSYFSLPVSNLPEIEYPTIQVSARFPAPIPMSWRRRSQLRWRASSP